MTKENKLPKDWSLISFGEVTNNFDGKRVPLSKEVRAKRKGSYRYYGATEIVDYIDDYIYDGKYLLIGEDGANLVSKSRDLAFIVEGKFWVNNHAHVVQAKNNLELNFLYYYFNSLNLAQFVTGTAQPKLNQSNLNKIPIPLPPLATQQAIVSKIEELFSELDAGIQNLKTSQAQLKTYRQAVLKWAFEGKLTNPKIKEGELPKGWIENSIRDVCDNIKVGIVIKPSNFYAKNGVGVKAFRSANVRELYINDSDWVYFSAESNEINYRTKLKEGDVLLVRSGYPGTSCVVTKQFENCNAIDILIATPNKEKVLPEYLCYFNNSPLGKGMFRDKSRGVAQKHLNVGEYSKLKIFIPSISEQAKIMQEIESSLSVADKMEESINQSLQQAEALRQSILKKAFEGGLI